MEPKYVNTNKEHTCGNCGEIIPKGTDCLYYEGRLPAYDEVDGHDKQTGIYYYKEWVHDYKCNMPEECRKGNHNFVKETGDLGAPTGEEVCTNCGTCKGFVMPKFEEV